MYPTTRKFSIAVLLSALMLVPPAVADDDSSSVAAKARVTRVTLDGETTTSGQLGAIYHETNMGPDAISAHLQVTSGNARTAVFHSTGAAGVYENERERRIDETPLQGATVRSERSGDFYYIGVFPSGPGAMVDVSGARESFVPGPPSDVRARAFVPSSIPSPVGATSTSTSWKPDAGPVTTTIRGSFVLVTWEYDLKIDGSETILASGNDDQPIASGVPGETSAAVYERTSRQVYVFVDDGTLELTTLEPSALAVLLNSPSAQIEGAATLHDVTAQVADGSELRETSGKALAVTGAFGISVTDVTETDLGVEVLGEPTSVSMDGEVLPWASAVQLGTSASPFRWWLVFAVGFVAAPGLVAGRVYGKRWIESRRMNDLEDMVEMAQWDAVAKSAPKLYSSPHFGFDARVLRVDALIRLGRFDEAATVAHSLRANNDVNVPVVDFTLAYLYAARGDNARAIEHALACVKAGPEFLENIRSIPAFASLRRDPRFKAAVPPEPATASPPGYA